MVESKEHGKGTGLCEAGLAWGCTHSETKPAHGNHKNQPRPEPGILGINLSSWFGHIMDKTKRKKNNSIFDLLRPKAEQNLFSFKNKSHNLSINLKDDLLPE